MSQLRCLFGCCEVKSDPEALLAIETPDEDVGEVKLLEHACDKVVELLPPFIPDE